MTTSAEQIAIALMAEARRLYGVAENVDRDRYDRNHGERELADRLAEWASQVRQLGVDRFEALAAAEARTNSAKTEQLESELTKCRGMLARISELAEMDGVNRVPAAIRKVLWS